MGILDHSFPKIFSLEKNVSLEAFQLMSHPQTIAPIGLYYMVRFLGFFTYDLISHIIYARINAEVPRELLIRMIQ